MQNKSDFANCHYHICFFNLLRRFFNPSATAFSLNRIFTHTSNKKKIIGKNSVAFATFFFVINQSS